MIYSDTDSVSRRPLPKIWHMDQGTREGRKSILSLARRALREARTHLLEGQPLQALDALLHAARMRDGLERYYALRRAVIADPRHNVGGHYRPW